MSLSFGVNKNSRIIVYFSIIISTIHSFYILWLCWQMCLSIPKTQVICNLTDCYQKIWLNW
ncbi:hypothetical protein Mgra_00009380 [Meloidogyne graminicola]|uniref:Uncharacterized protein n=1 Tax=Meloidogyne graminicola TaxID=189291 RepID=A0A8S9ZC13_9BILA|nr:hypothetical protein Mgra_00009380 [Meloidogyne graminicola]